MKNIVRSFFIFGLALLLWTCGSDTEKAELPEAIDLPAETGQMLISQEQFDAAGMQLGQPELFAFPKIIQVNGYLDVPPRGRAAVSVYYGGYIKGLDLLPGQAVRRGQVLFRLENPDYVQMQQDYLEAKAQLAYLEADYERQKTLAAENIASQKNYLKAESDFRVQQARMEGLRKKLTMLGIDLDRVEAKDFVSEVAVYAPINGFITAVNVNSGSFLDGSTIALEITNTEHLHLELEVFEKDVQYVQKGQLIQFRTPGSATASRNAEVYMIGSVVEGENRIVRVHGHLEEEGNTRGLVPGMYIEAEIQTEVDSVTALPETAVVKVENTSFIVVRHDRSGDTYIFERMEVQPGRQMKGMVEITGGLPRLDGPVLTKGAFNLIMEEE